MIDQTKLREAIAAILADAEVEAVVILLHDAEASLDVPDVRPDLVPQPDDEDTCRGWG